MSERSELVDSYGFSNTEVFYWAITVAVAPYKKFHCPIAGRGKAFQYFSHDDQKTIILGAISDARKTLDIDPKNVMFERTKKGVMHAHFSANCTNITARLFQYNVAHVLSYPNVDINRCCNMIPTKIGNTDRQIGWEWYSMKNFVEGSHNKPMALSDEQLDINMFI